jgi:hypothetical protein
MAGFQSIEEFLRDGAINQMPAEIAEQVRVRIEVMARGHH